MSFSTTVIQVSLLLLLASPGYILVKANKKHLQALPTMSVLAIYITQPLLTIYSFQKLSYSVEMLKDIGIFFGLFLLSTIILCSVSYILFHKNIKTDTNKRICSACSFCGNYGFFGLPVLQVLFYNQPEVIVYSAIAVVVLQLFSWTYGAYLVSGNRKYMSVKSALINPAMLSTALAMLLYVTTITIPSQINNILGILGNATTPLAMIILGMRFATVSARDFIGNGWSYASIAVKLIISPLIMFAIIKIFGIDGILGNSIVILAAMPPAISVLTFAELHNASPKETSNIIMLGSLLSILTIPLVSLLL